MSEEQIISPIETFSERTRYKQLERELKEVELQFRKEGKAACFSCMTVDYNGSQVKELKEYIITTKPLKTREVYHNKDNTKWVGRDIEFSCNRGIHKVTLALEANEAKALESKEVKK